MTKKKKDIITYILIALVGAAIAVAGVLSKQSLIRIGPLFVSLFVSYLQSKVSRYAALLGGINSIYYAIIYFYYNLYASAAYAILVSFPLQIITFARWQKKRWNNTTVFRKMSWQKRLLTVAAFAAAWGIMYIVLNALGSDYVLLDNTLTLFGILVSFLMMFAYIEYTALMIPSVIINIILATSMLRKYPEQSAYLIYDIYCLFCQIRAFITIRRAYKEQQTELNANAQ